MCKLTHVRNKTPQKMINDRMAIIPKLSIFQFNNFYLKKKKKVIHFMVTVNVVENICSCYHFQM